MSAGSQTVAALEAAWQSIQQRHPELPDVMMITGNGQKPKSVVRGHFHARQWEQRSRADLDLFLGAEPSRLHELFVSGQCMESGAKQVMTTLLHEATHALCHEAEIKDTRKGCQYHTKAFAQKGATLGLAYEGEPSRTLGYSDMKITPEAEGAYADEITALENAIDVCRQQVGSLAAAGSKAKDRNFLKLVCGCGRTIRASRKTHEEGPIPCGLCGTEFESEV